VIGLTVLNSCQRLFPALSVLGLVFLVFSDGTPFSLCIFWTAHCLPAVAVLYVAALWDRNSSVFRMLIFSFAVTNGATIAFIGVSMSITFRKSLFFS
jgi:hypothetical protein